MKLVDRRMLAPTVGHYQFLRDDGQPLDFQPGQFIQVHFQYADGTQTKRDFIPETALVRRGLKRGDGRLDLD
jgi:ferredoxin-NADP reductase